MTGVTERYPACQGSRVKYRKASKRTLTRGMRSPICLPVSMPTCRITPNYRIGFWGSFDLIPTFPTPLNHLINHSGFNSRCLSERSGDPACRRCHLRAGRRTVIPAKIGRRGQGYDFISKVFSPKRLNFSQSNENSIKATSSEPNFSLRSCGTSKRLKNRL